MESRIRSDTTWNVPEPELALVMNPLLEVVGMTIGNDMSSRDIEGENPFICRRQKSTRHRAPWGMGFCCGPWMNFTYSYSMEIHRKTPSFFS